MTRTRILAGLVLLVLAALGWMAFGSGKRAAITANARVNVPELNRTAAEGVGLYTKFCVECHGENAAGSNKGPSLIHRFYRPNHHIDQTFLAAALYGVRQHHWKFGNMKPIEGIAEDEVIKIITYVRAVQRANGIE